MIRCVVFDFDGTLVESNLIKRQAFFDVAGRFQHGIKMMENVLREAVDRDRYWVFERFAEGLSGSAEAAELAECYTRICEARIVAAPEITGANSSLERLRGEGKQLFLNSATPAGPLAALARLRHLDGLFEDIYGGPTKKHENLADIRLKYRFASEEILVVGDGESDRLSAETTGCHFVAVENEDNDFSREPFFRIPDMLELPETVHRISSAMPLGA